MRYTTLKSKKKFKLTKKCCYEEKIIIAYLLLYFLSNDENFKLND